MSERSRLLHFQCRVGIEKTLAILLLLVGCATACVGPKTRPKADIARNSSVNSAAPSHSAQAAIGAIEKEVPSASWLRPTVTGIGPTPLKISAGGYDTVYLGRVWSMLEGRRLVVFTGFNYSLFDLQSKQEIYRIASGRDAQPFALSADGSEFSMFDQQGFVHRFDFDTGYERQILIGVQCPQTLDYAPSGQALAAIGCRQALVFDLTSERGQFRELLPRIWGGEAWNSNSTRFAGQAADGRGGVIIYDAQSGKPLRRLAIDLGSPTRNSLAYVGRRTLAASASGNLEIWDEEQAKRVATRYSVGGMVATADAGAIAAESRVPDFPSYRQCLSLRAYDWGVKCIEGNARPLALDSAGKTLFVTQPSLVTAHGWSSEYVPDPSQTGGIEQRAIKGRSLSAPELLVAPSPNWKSIGAGQSSGQIVACRNACASQWDNPEDTEQSPPRVPHHFEDCKFCWYKGCGLGCWEIEAKTGKALKWIGLSRDPIVPAGSQEYLAMNYKDYDRPVVELFENPDGSAPQDFATGILLDYDVVAQRMLLRQRALLGGCEGSRLLLRNRRSVSITAEFEVRSYPTAVAISRDGRRLAWGGYPSSDDCQRGTPRVELWDVEKATRIGTQPFEYGENKRIALSDDASLLAIVQSSWLRLVSGSDNSIVREFKLPIHGLDHLAFAADGKTLLASLDDDGSVIAWSAISGQVTAWSGPLDGRTVSLLRHNDSQLLQATATGILRILSLPNLETINLARIEDDLLPAERRANGDPVKRSLACWDGLHLLPIEACSKGPPRRRMPPATGPVGPLENPVELAREMTRPLQDCLIRMSNTRRTVTVVISNSRQAKVLDPATSQSLGTIDTSTTHECNAALSSDGQWLAWPTQPPSSTQPTFLEVYRIDQRSLMWSVPLAVPDAVSSDGKEDFVCRSNRTLVFDPTGHLVAVDAGRAIQIHEVTTGNLKAVIPIQSAGSSLRGAPTTRMTFENEHALTTVILQNETRRWDLRSAPNVFSYLAR